MSEEITFGEVEHAEPESEIRPDQNAQFATVDIGECRPGELEIFVDLDVMRDMEAHAISNTRVELGGVMLGKQLVDQNGVPYVVVTDSLRAEHYEATKGSFKFTHDTWSQITRQREAFHPDLEMVGWYHTHPGWSVFLSGMDLFICNNFFNRPLDVALVIDPCEQDRGWFQWNDADPPATKRTGGFKLMTGRLRKDELDYFARIYNKEPDMNYDPRYGATSPGSTSVQLMDGRKSNMEIAIMGMLALQFMLLMLLGWRMIGPTQAPSDDVVALQEKIDELENERAHSQYEEIYRDEFNRLALAKTGDKDWSKELVDLRYKQRMVESNLEAQIISNQKLQYERDRLDENLTKVTKTQEKQKLELDRRKKQISEKNDLIKELKDAQEGKKSLGSFDWALTGGCSLLALAIGLFAGFYFAGKNDVPPEAAPEYDAKKTKQLANRAAETPPVDDGHPDTPANANQPIAMTPEPGDSDVVKFQD